MPEIVNAKGIPLLADVVECLKPIDSEHRVVLGIAGPPGAGKTTLVLLLIEELRRRRGDSWVAHLPMDGFHLADIQLRRLGRFMRKGAPDTFDREGYSLTLHRARCAGQGLYVPGFERELEQPLAAAIFIPEAANLVITEGNYLLLSTWKDVRSACDEVWYLLADDQVRRARLVERHVLFGKDAPAAKAWVLSVDERNALLVDNSAVAADRYIANGVDGWGFVHVAS